MNFNPASHVISFVGSRVCSVLFGEVEDGDPGVDRFIEDNVALDQLHTHNLLTEISLVSIELVKCLINKVP